jgi:hypothetical protein
MDNDALGRRATVPAAPVRDLLAVHAATREQTADDHMFTVTSWSGTGPAGSGSSCSPLPAPAR